MSGMELAWGGRTAEQEAWSQGSKSQYFNANIFNHRMIKRIWLNIACCLLLWGGIAVSAYSDADYESDLDKYQVERQDQISDLIAVIRKITRHSRDTSETSSIINYGVEKLRKFLTVLQDALPNSPAETSLVYLDSLELQNKMDQPEPRYDIIGQYVITELEDLKRSIMQAALDLVKQDGFELNKHFVSCILTAKTFGIDVRTELPRYAVSMAFKGNDILGATNALLFLKRHGFKVTEDIYALVYLCIVREQNYAFNTLLEKISPSEAHRIVNREILFRAAASGIDVTRATNHVVYHLMMNNLMSEKNLRSILCFAVTNKIDIRAGVSAALILSSEQRTLMFASTYGRSLLAGYMAALKIAYEEKAKNPEKYVQLYKLGKYFHNNGEDVCGPKKAPTFLKKSKWGSVDSYGFFKRKEFMTPDRIAMVEDIDQKAQALIDDFAVFEKQILEYYEYHMNNKISVDYEIIYSRLKLLETHMEHLRSSLKIRYDHPETIDLMMFSKLYETYFYNFRTLLMDISVYYVQLRLPIDGFSSLLEKFEIQVSHATAITALQEALLNNHARALALFQVCVEKEWDCSLEMKDVLFYTTEQVSARKYFASYEQIGISLLSVFEMEAFRSLFESTAIFERARREIIHIEPSTFSRLKTRAEKRYGAILEKGRNHSKAPLVKSRKLQRPQYPQSKRRSGPISGSASIKNILVA